MSLNTITAKTTLGELLALHYVAKFDGQIDLEDLADDLGLSVHDTKEMVESSKLLKLEGQSDVSALDEGIFALSYFDVNAPFSLEDISGILTRLHSGAIAEYEKKVTE
jgi:hypothetical protein